MTTDLRKRLEEAARTHWEERREDYEDEHREVFRYGANFGYDKGKKEGYREAIKVATEWMKENALHYSNTVIGRKAIIYDLEAEMNKLWEEKE